MDKLLKEMIEEINPFDEFDEDTELLEEGILDSLSVMVLVERSEEALNMKIPKEEMTLENFNTLNSIKQMIKRIQ